MKDEIKLRKGEKIIQLVKGDVYWIGLTNKGKFLQLKVYEFDPLEDEESGAIFIMGELGI